MIASCQISSNTCKIVANQCWRRRPGTAVVVEERRNQLLDLVRSRGFASLPELRDELKVSLSTVRRDLDYLEEAGTAKRTHGGVFYVGPSPVLPEFEERQPE